MQALIQLQTSCPSLHTDPWRILKAPVMVADMKYSDSLVRVALFGEGRIPNTLDANKSSLFYSALNRSVCCFEGLGKDTPVLRTDKNQLPVSSDVIRIRRRSRAGRADGPKAPSIQTTRTLGPQVNMTYVLAVCSRRDSIYPGLQKGNYMVTLSFMCILSLCLEPLGNWDPFRGFCLRGIHKALGGASAKKFSNGEELDVLRASETNSRAALTGIVGDSLSRS